MNNVFYLERTANGSNQISLKTKLLERGIIYLDEQINHETVNAAIQQIALLAAQKPRENITMLINCPGGSIQDGLVLIDVMRAYDGIIKTVSLGSAASMAAVILAAGTKGHRYCSLHSQVMLHQPLISGGIPGGNCSEIEEVARALVSRKNQLNRLLADFTGREQEEMEKLTATDNYMSAEEALEHGLIDRIADGKELYELIGGNAI